MNISAIGHGFFRVWVYLIFLFIIAALNIRLKLRRTSFIMVITGACLLNTVGLFFTAGSPDYRYSICIVFSCVVAACLMSMSLLERALQRQTVRLQL